MLRIKAIKIEVETTSGLFGTFQEFTSGLNIIRGNNSAGKSTLFQSILYCLGLEELLGGRNEKTMQSALKEYVLFEDFQHAVIESSVYLEINNEKGEIATIRRYVKGLGRNSKLIDVYTGAFLTDAKSVTSMRPMYVHDSGAASDEVYGFHSFLEEFVGWQLPEVPTSNRTAYTKLYFQLVAPAFIVEQKRGWSDFLANAPYYGIKDGDSRAIEFLLNLDVFENQKRKQELTQRRHILALRWRELYSYFSSIAQRTGGKIVNLPDSPEIINNTQLIRIVKEEDQEQLNIEDFLERKRKDLADLEVQPVPTVGVNLTPVRFELNKLTRRHNQFLTRLKMIITDYSSEQDTLVSYDDQLKQIRQELKRNKSAKKVADLGAVLSIETSTSHCPTCHQHVSDTLLPTLDSPIPMHLDDNIAYLEAQEKMVYAFITAQRSRLNEGLNSQQYYEREIDQMRNRMRTLEQELISDERLPSEAVIEKKVNLKNSISFHTRMAEEMVGLISKLSDLSDDWKRLLTDEKNLPSDFLSSLDRTKLSTLQNDFKALLQRFHYQSNGLSSVIVPTDSYLPTIRQDGVAYNIRFDSSASDLVRCIWAYICALYKLSEQYKPNNHPGLLMFDEPAQHSVSDNDFSEFLKELASYKQAQTFVFASFNNEDSEFEKTTKGITYSLVKIEKLIRPFSSN
jgi:hypothetical protein